MNFKYSLRSAGWGTDGDCLCRGGSDGDCPVRGW